MLSHPMRPAALAALTPMLFLLGCSTAPVDVAPSAFAPHHAAQQQADRAAARSAPAKPGALPRCVVYLEKVEDVRKDKDHMGTVAGRPVHGVDMTDWVSSGVATLEGTDFYVDTQAQADDAMKVDVQVIKAYMGSVYTSITSNIVVKVTYMRPDSSVLGEENYRGTDTSINWASGDGEIAQDFKLATGDMLKSMRPDVSRYCQTAKQPATVATAG